MRIALAVLSVRNPDWNPRRHQLDRILWRVDVRHPRD
jgi:hypothetical protein